MIALEGVVNKTREKQENLWPYITSGLLLILSIDVLKRYLTKL